MKSIIAIVTVGALSMGLASEAQASLYKLSPVGNFTASGSTVLSAGSTTINCVSTFSGKITATGAGAVTHFSAVGDPLCSAIVATLPWPAVALTATTIEFKKVTVGIPGVVTCGGPTQVFKSTDNAGTVSWNAALGICSTSGTVVTTPSVLIVHK
jgi:hypothetical protein